MTQQFADLVDVKPLGTEDRAFLEEVREVLARHNQLDRFGLTLLHDHFSLAENEMLMETCDPEHRTLSIVPQVIDPNVTLGRVVETAWHFTAEGEVVAGLVCKVGCFVDLKDKHSRTHQRVNG